MSNLVPRGVGKRIKRMCEEAGFNPEGVTSFSPRAAPHSR